MALMKKGAEANIYLQNYENLFCGGAEEKVIVKHRIRKLYRNHKLDLHLRKSRTTLEAKLISDAKRAGVPTPVIYRVDLDEMKIIMEYIDGVLLKKALEKQADRRRTCWKIGQQVAKLHKAGIIHGDLTTSNMILTGEGKIVFVDFGLGDYSRSVEERGVDLHLLKRALTSTHFRIADEAFKAILAGYRNEFGSGAGEAIKRAEEIEKRGRYVARDERAWC